MRAGRADYGLDAPGVVRTMLLLGLGLLAFGLFARTRPGWGRYESIALSMGLAYFLSGCLMVASSRFGKLRARNRLLDRLELRGTERVLDVGCGHGLLLIGAAHRLGTGRAGGVDLWSQGDQHANSAAATESNARAEGVADRIDVRDGDMRALPFDDASFDVVVSSLAVHNVSGREDRRRAIAEIARVLVPGGRVALMDIAHVRQYADDLRVAGLEAVTVSGWSPWIFPPARTVTGRRPAA